MRPLKVTWKLSSPVALPTYPIHLDALLAWAKVNRAIQEGGYENPFEEQENLPLESANETWKASRLVFEAAAEPFLVPFIRKANVVEFADDRRRGYYESNRNSFTLGTGPYKAFDMRLPAQIMSKATAWCVGNKEEIESLLCDVTAIGKWSKNGYGAVSSFTVEAAPAEEIEFWRNRVLPAHRSDLLLPDVPYAPSAGRCRPPYWDKTNMAMVMIPQ